MKKIFLGLFYINLFVNRINLFVTLFIDKSFSIKDKMFLRNSIFVSILTQRFSFIINITLTYSGEKKMYVAVLYNKLKILLV